MRTGVLWGEEHTDFNLLTLLLSRFFSQSGHEIPSPDPGAGLLLYPFRAERAGEHQKVRS